MLVALCFLKFLFWTGFCCLEHSHVFGHLSFRGVRSAELQSVVCPRKWFSEQQCVEIIKTKVLAGSYSKRFGSMDQMPLHRSTVT